MDKYKFTAKRIDNGNDISGYLMYHKRFMEIKAYIKQDDRGPIEWIEVKEDTIKPLAHPTESKAVEVGE